MTRRVAAWHGPASAGGPGVGVVEGLFVEATFLVERFAEDGSRNASAVRSLAGAIAGCPNAAVTVRIEGEAVGCRVLVSVRVPAAAAPAERLRAIFGALAAEGIRLRPVEASCWSGDLGWVREVAEFTRAERFSAPLDRSTYGIAGVYGLSALPGDVGTHDGHEGVRAVYAQRCALELTLGGTNGLTEIERQAVEEYTRVLDAWRQPRTLHTQAGVFSQARSVELPALAGAGEAAEKLRAFARTVADSPTLLTFAVRAFSAQPGSAALVAQRYSQSNGLDDLLGVHVVRAGDPGFDKVLAAVQGGYCSPALASRAWKEPIAPLALRRLHRLVAPNDVPRFAMLPCRSDRGPVPHVATGRAPSRAWTLSMAMAEEGYWQASSNDGLDAPFAVIQGEQVPSWQAGELVRVRFDDDTPGGLVGGRPGSGKSKLLHNIIVSLTSRYSPEELTLYLVDLKEGVEFVGYSTLPHVRVLAVESDRELAVAVLRDLCRKMTERATAFRRAGVSHIRDFRRQTGQALPRVLLIVDEFQVLFEPGGAGDYGPDAVASLFEQIAAKGRFAGIHMLLSTQSYVYDGGAYWLTEKTQGNSPLRLAMQLLDHGQAARLLKNTPEDIDKLTRTGELIVEDNGRGREHAVARALYERGEATAGMSEKEAADGAYQRFLRACVTRAGSEWQRMGRPKAAPVVFEGSQLPLLEDGIRVARKVACGCVLFGQSLDVDGSWVGITHDPDQPSHGLLVGARLDQLWLTALCATTIYLASDLSAKVVMGTVAACPARLTAEVRQFVAHWGDRIAFQSGEGAVTDLLLRAAGEVAGGAGGARLIVLLGPERARSLSGPSYESTAEKEALYAILRDGGPAGTFVLACSSSWGQVSALLPSEQLSRFGARVALSLPDAVGVVDRIGDKLELPRDYGVALIPGEGILQRFRLPAEATGAAPLLPGTKSIT